MNSRDGPQGVEKEEMSMIFSTSPVEGSFAGIGALDGSKLDASHSRAVADKASGVYDWGTDGYGFGTGMSTLAELGMFASDPFTIPLSALVNDYGLAQERRDRQPSVVSRTSSAISRPLAIGTSATAQDARWRTEPASPESFVSSPCLSIGSSTNQRGIRIATAHGKAVERRPPLASPDSACSYDSYTTDFTTPATSFHDEEDEHSARDRKGKGRATTQVAALVDSPPFSPTMAAIPCTSVASTSSMPVGLLSNVTSTSPDGLGHYSPDVADLLRIPHFELERKAFDWNEFERTLGRENSDGPSSFSAATQAEPFVPIVTGLGLDLSPSTSTRRSHDRQEPLRERPQSLYFPTCEDVNSATIVQAPEPTNMALQEGGTARNTNRRHTISMYNPPASLAAQRYVLDPTRRARATEAEANGSEPGPSTRHRPHSISIDTNGDRSSSIQSRPYSVNRSPKLRKQSITFSSWLKGKSPTISRAASIGPSSPATSTRQIEECKDSVAQRPRKLYKDKGRAQTAPNPFPFTVTPESILYTDTKATPPALEESGAVAEATVPPVEEKPVVSLFDAVLPREIRVWVFVQLVISHQEDFEKRLRKGEWSTVHANRERWVGKDAGMRDLIKLSRVSKSWLSLVLDGQLWHTFDLTAFPGLSSSLILKIAQCTGSFVQTLNLRGHSQIKPSSLLAIASALSGMPNPTRDFISLEGPLTVTQLTTINLVGCSALTTQSLRFLLFRSPGVQHLHLRGLDCVTNSTLIDDIGPHCRQLVTLDIRRCTHVRGIALANFAIRSLERMIVSDRPSPLKTLKASGLRGVNAEVLRQLGRAFPLLQVLDLSHCRDVSDDGFAAFVDWPTPTSPPNALFSFIDTPKEKEWSSFHISMELTSREAGLDPSDPSRHWRRVTSLRHLNVSGCRRISDKMCTEIAHTVPQLEFLEMAAVSPEVKDDGLLRLFKTTSRIRKVDLEDAVDITDAVLDCLVPTPRTPPENGTKRDEELQPGEMLEHLVISYAGLLSPAAMGRLVKGCKQLRVLEADNTRITGSVIRDFVSRRRHREKSLLLSETPGNLKGQPGSEIVAIDCRGVSEECIHDVQAYTRPRRGWRGWEARELAFEDQRSVGVKDPLTGAVGGPLIGQDECDPHRVVVKSFHGWVSVDAVAEQRTKLKGGSGAPGKADIPRWLTHWSLGRRAGLGSNAGTPEEREDRGCVVQ